MQSEIRNAIQEVLNELGISKVDFAVEHPADTSHGDYATNVAMTLMRSIAQKGGVSTTNVMIGGFKDGQTDWRANSPRVLSEEIKKRLEGKIPHVSKIEIAGPGFINFHLDRNFFKEKIADILANPDTWGKNDSLVNEEIIFEYTSPNLFKPLHVGNLVGNIVGESISRLFEAGGATLRRVNYPSDIGLTVAKGVWGLTQTQGDPNDINQIGEAYRFGNDAYEKGGEEKEAIEAVNRALYKGDDGSLNTLRVQGIATSRARLSELCRMLGTSFDIEIFESEASEPGTKIVREHTGDIFEESDGAVIYRGEKHGLHTRVFLNSQGLPTYEAKDVGNFALKQKKYPSWTQSFVVTGGEQREYFKVLISALREVFPEAKSKIIEHLPTGFLTLTTGKMSSRKGNVLTGEAILEEVQTEAKERAEISRVENFEEITEMVAVGALKYQILRQGIGTDIVFDKDKALSFEGDSGPYLMYTHARICSLLRKAEEAGIHINIVEAPEEPYALEKLVYQFPEIVLKAQRERAPHHVVVFLTELASAFNTFYAQEKIVDTTDEFAPYKLALATAVRMTLKNGLWVLGIKAPERM